MAGAVVESESAINEGQGIPKPQLDVTARPVDTYVSPVNPDRSALGQLAGSLKELNPELGKIAERFQEQAAKQGATQGAEAFQQTHGDYAQAIQKGLLPHVFNPYARIAARETFGRLGAEKFRSDMWSDPDFNKAIDGATTIQAFDQATQAFQSKWDSTNLGHVSHSDSAFQNAFQTLRQGHLMDDRLKFADQVNKNFVGMTSENFQADQSATLRNAIEDGSFLKDPSHIASILSAQMASYTSKGFSPRLATSANAAAIAQLAHDVGAGTAGDGSVTAQDIFNLAKQIPGSKDKSLYDDSEYMGKLRTQTLDKLTQEQRVKYQVDRLRDAEETKNTIHDTYSSLYTDAAKGDLKSMDTYRSQLASVSEVEARRLPKIYEALNGTTWPTDPKTEGDIVHNIGLHTDPHDPDYVTRDEIEDALVHHMLTPDTALKLLKSVSSRDSKGAGKTYDPLTDSDWREFKSTAGATLIMTGDRENDKITAGKVNLDLSRRWEDFMEQNPDATRQQKGAFLDSAYVSSVKKWAAPGDWSMFFQGTGQAMVHSANADYEHEMVLPENLVDEAAAAIATNHKTGKPIPTEILESLKEWHLTDGPSIIRAIRAQKALYEPPATDKVPE